MPPDPPRVLMVTPRYLPLIGGVENHVAQVAARLARRGVDVTVLTADPGGRLPVEERIGGVRVRRARAYPAGSDLCFAPGMAPIITAGGWDLVHIQSYHTLVAPLAMWAARRGDVPYVLTFHGGGHSSRLRSRLRGAQRRVLRPLLAGAARLVAVARFEVERFSAELGLPVERFTLIPNGADLPPAPAGIAPEPGLIVSPGRLERYKGHQRVIAALPAVLRAVPEARLRVAGSGPYEAELRRLAARLGVGERVAIGPVPPEAREAMAAELARAALVVLLSEYETQPIAVLEAVALGRPALVADTAGLRELAERGLARALPAASTTAEVAAAVVGELRRPRVPPRVALPSWDACAAELHALYGEVVAGVGAPRAYAHLP